MAQVLVRNLSAAVIARLKERARRNGRSLQAELVDILEAAAGPDWAEVRALAARLRRRFAGRRFSDSTILIRRARGKL